MIRTLIIAIALLAGLLPMQAAGDGSIDKRDFRLSWGADKVNVYTSEPTVLTLYLWTPEVEVRGVAKSKDPQLDKSEFSFIRKAEVSSQGKVVEKDGRRWYVYAVDSYAVTLAKPGKYHLKNGRYIVEVAVPVVYDDPFWGRMQAMDSRQFELPVKNLEINVKGLPSNKGREFSGAVGNFSVDVTVPPGDIYLNEEAIAVVTVKGPGWINEHTLPEYREAFGQGTRLKSFSENRKQYLEDGRLVSEIELECTFIPTDKNATINQVSMDFFNPETGKYETVKSSSVKVKVSSIAGKSKSLDI